MSTPNSQGRWEFDENGNVHYVQPEGDDGSSTSGGNYHYQYAHSGGQSKNSTKRNTKSDDGWHWILIVLGFIVFWPAGLILMFLQLGGKWPGNKKTDQEFRRAASAAQNAAKQAWSQMEKSRQQQKTTGTASSATRVNAEKWREELSKTRAAQARAQSKKKKKNQKQDEGAPYGLGHIGLFRGIGLGIAGLFGFAFVMELLDEIRYFYSWEWLLSETMPLLALCLIGLTLIGVAGSRKRKLTRFQKYLTMIGMRKVVPISSLAKSMGVSEKKVEKDLEEMLERDFWDDGYVDAARKALVLGAPLEDVPEPEPEVKPESDEPTDTATATLSHIRQVNDAIANEELSDKIDRIEELTAKIFKLLDERPEKASELRSFMNYYLPQTLKILESYSKLEAQGIEGENIAEAKGKIEAMMDKLVDGYEAQLDKLFADDVLDISADLKVMESMLEKDGLTADCELKF